MARDPALHIFLSAVEQGVRQCSPGAGPASRIGALQPFFSGSRHEIGD